jgi:hypothetical protein
MKKTLVVIHTMPYEIEMFERFIKQYNKSISYLDENDDVTLKVTLNLNPELTDWDNSELKQDYFIDIFNKTLDGINIKLIKEIITDNSLWGTTQQKRESIELDFDQFIFVDNDILVHEMQLKYQLLLSYQLNGMYIVSPSLAKWWDTSWDFICHSDYLNKHVGYGTERPSVENTFTQEIKEVEGKLINGFKFGCGMHTLYSKSFWKFVSIPEAYGGYGPEDTYGMFAAEYAVTGRAASGKTYDIKQYFTDGIYISEDYFNRTPSFDGKIKLIDRKKDFYERAKSLTKEQLIAFLNRI